MINYNILSIIILEFLYKLVISIIIFYFFLNIININSILILIRFIDNILEYL